MRTLSPSSIRTFATDLADLDATGSRAVLLMMAPAIACAGLAWVGLIGFLLS